VNGYDESDVYDDEPDDYDEEDRQPSRRRIRTRTKYCHECGSLIRSRAVVCPKCGVEQPAALDQGSGRGGNRVGAAVCGILIGGLGIHKFIIGATGAGITMLLVSLAGVVLTPCLIFPILAPMAMGIIGLVEGIIYLTKTDEQFYRDYIRDRRAWF
jgi:TM2 domain-containing membrane protein YozV